MKAIFCIILAIYLFYVARAFPGSKEGNFYRGLFAIGSFLAVICGSILAAIGK